MFSATQRGYLDNEGANQKQKKAVDASFACVKGAKTFKQISISQLTFASD